MKWNDPIPQTEGTSGAGIYLNVSLETLLEKLGQPTRIGSGDNKVQVEWAFCDDVKSDDLEKVQCFTIYDWKTHCPIHEINDWHIGSKNLSRQEVISELKVLGFDEEQIKQD